MRKITLLAAALVALSVAGCTLDALPGVRPVAEIAALPTLPPGPPRPDPAQTCSVSETPLDTQLEAARTVFVGRVLGVGGSEDTDGGQVHRVRLAVERVLRGEPPPVPALIDLTFVDCWFWDGARVGDRYVVLATRTSLGPSLDPVDVAVGYQQGLHPLGSPEADEVERRLGGAAGGP